jgi:hypothetical protein
MLTYGTGPSLAMAGLDPPICTGTAACKDGPVKPGHDGFTAAPSLS